MSHSKEDAEKIIKDFNALTSKDNKSKDDTDKKSSPKSSLKLILIVTIIIIMMFFAAYVLMHMKPKTKGPKAQANSALNNAAPALSPAPPASIQA